MSFDGSLMKMGASISLVFVSPLGVHMKYSIRLHFPASNNVVEYEALFSGLKIAIELGIQRLQIQGNSQLVIDHIMKESSCYDDITTLYCQEVRKIENKFDGLKLKHIPRCLNEAADALAKMASGWEQIPPGVFANDQYQPSVRPKGSMTPGEGSSGPAQPEPRDDESPPEPA